MLSRRKQIHEMKELLLYINNLELVFKEDGHLIQKQKFANEIYHQIKTKLYGKSLIDFSEEELAEMTGQIDKSLTGLDGNRKQFMLEMKRLINITLKNKNSKKYSKKEMRMNNEKTCISNK